MRFRFWVWMHNCIAHPLEGWAVLLTGQCPRWIDRFQEWTAKQAWPEEIKPWRPESWDS